MLAKKHFDHVAIGIIRNSVLRERETEELVFIIISSFSGTIGSGVVTISSVFLGMVVTVFNKVALQGEVITKLVLSKRETVLIVVPVCVEERTHLP